MEYFDKQMALDVVEDALTDIDSAYGRGQARGLCGAFYMCGLLSQEEWEAFLERIPAEPCQSSDGQTLGIGDSGASVRGRFLN